MDTESVVLDAQTYYQLCQDPQLQWLLRASFFLETVVFVGCGAGMNDPNFDALFAFVREALRHSFYRHYFLCRRSEVKERAKQFEGLPVTALGYGEEFHELTPFLERIVEDVRQRQSTDPVAALRRSQADYQMELTVLESQRPTLVPNEFVRLSYDVNRRMWAAGGRGSAVLNMEGAWEQSADGLPVPDMLAYGLEVIERLLDLEYGSKANFMLQKLIRKLGDQPIPSEQRARFDLVRTRCLSVAGSLDAALAALEEAEGRATPADRARYAAERAELNLLNGNLAAAAGDTDGASQ